MRWLAGLSVMLAAAVTTPKAISYLANGTGAVSQQLSRKVGESISVKDFGAKGDNSTDDTAAINNAIQAAVNAQTFSGCVYFPPGRYIVTDTIKMYNTGSNGTADGLCLYGDSGLASQIRWNTNDVSKPVVSIHAASPRLDNITIDMLGDALTAVAYDGDVTIGRSTMGAMRNLHINCENHLGDGIQLGAGTSQADMLELDHPQIENCSQGSALKTFNANVLNINVIAPFFNRNWIGYNVNDSSNVHVLGGGHDAHDLVVKKSGLGSFEMFGARSEGPKKFYFDSAGSVGAPVTFIGLRIDSMQMTRANSITGSITSGTASLTLSAAGYTFGDTLILSTAGAAGATLKVTIINMTDPTHATVSANASTTMTAGAIGFYGYGSVGARCTVSTTNTLTAVTFSSPWCMNPGEFITITGAGLNGRQIVSCSDSTNCTMQNAATATLPTASWFNAGSALVPQQPQDAFHFQALGPYTIMGCTFGGSTATNITGGGGAGASAFNIVGNFWNTDPGNSTPWSSPQLPASIGAQANNNTFGTTVATGPTLGTIAFASLPAAPPNGTLLYCSDCTLASPCAAAGTGALAKRINGAWVCN